MPPLLPMPVSEHGQWTYSVSQVHEYAEAYGRQCAEAATKEAVELLREARESVIYQLSGMGSGGPQDLLARIDAYLERSNG